MKYSKSKGYMNSPVGMYSTKSNPLKMASQVKPQCGLGGNADQRKANMLLQKAQKQQDSQRGMSGM